MYVLGRHQHVHCNPSINAAPAHSMNNLNTLALDTVPFIQKKSVNSKRLLHLFSDSHWNLENVSTAHACVSFPYNRHKAKGCLHEGPKNYKLIPLLLQTPYCLVDTLGMVKKQSWERNQVSNIAGKIEAHQNIIYSTHRTRLMGRPDTDCRRHHYSETDCPTVIPYTRT